MKATDFYKRAYALQQNGEHDQAIADFGQAIRLDPKFALAFVRRGFSYNAKYEYEKTISDLHEAISDLNEALRLDPLDAAAFSFRGYAHNAKGDYDQAIDDYNEAIRLNPKISIFFYHRALAYYHKDEYDKAIDDYDATLKLKPKYALAFNGLGVARHAKGDHDKAILDFNEAIRLDPKYAQAFANRGDAHAAKTAYDRAVADYDEALRLNPNLPSVIDARIKALDSYFRKTAETALQRRQERVLDDYEALVLAYRRFEFVSSVKPPGRKIACVPSVFHVPDSRLDPSLISVMMPFDPAFKDVFIAIKSASEGVGMSCKRGDDIWEHSAIINDVFSLIFRSGIVVCDFTGRNPNVFYEAGIAHTLGKHVVPIAQSTEDVPFDLRHHRFITYSNDPAGRKSLVKSLDSRFRYLASL